MDGTNQRGDSVRVSGRYVDEQDGKADQFDGPLNSSDPPRLPGRLPWPPVTKPVTRVLAL